MPQGEQDYFIRVFMQRGWIQADFIVMSEYIHLSDGDHEVRQGEIFVEAKANGSRASYEALNSNWIEKFERDLLFGRFGDAPDSLTA